MASIFNFFRTGSTIIASKLGKLRGLVNARTITSLISKVAKSKAALAMITGAGSFLGGWLVSRVISRTKADFNDTDEGRTSSTNRATRSYEAMRTNRASRELRLLHSALAALPIVLDDHGFDRLTEIKRSISSCAFHLTRYFSSLPDEDLAEFAFTALRVAAALAVYDAKLVNDPADSEIIACIETLRLEPEADYISVHRMNEVLALSQVLFIS